MPGDGADTFLGVYPGCWAWGKWVNKELKLAPVLVSLSLSFSDMSFDNSLFAISTVSCFISWLTVLMPGRQGPPQAGLTCCF